MVQIGANNPLTPQTRAGRGGKKKKKEQSTRFFSALYGWGPYNAYFFFSDPVVGSLLLLPLARDKAVLIPPPPPPPAVRNGRGGVWVGICFASFSRRRKHQSSCCESFLFLFKTKRNVFLSIATKKIRMDTTIGGRVRIE